VAPDPGLDQCLAVLAGAWEGNWGFGLPNALPSRVTVERITPTEATIVYANGDSPNGQIRADVRRYTASVASGSQFEFGQGVRFIFRLLDGTVLSGLRVQGQTTLATVNMHRCSP